MVKTLRAFCVVLASFVVASSVPTDVAADRELVYQLRRAAQQPRIFSDASDDARKRASTFNPNSKAMGSVANKHPSGRIYQLAMPPVYLVTKLAHNRRFRVACGGNAGCLRKSDRN